MIGVLLLAVGAPLVAAGVRVATSKRKPAAFLGALAAPVGLVLVLLGLARLVAPSLFAR